jgi:anti-sigma factor RsiW
MKCSTIHDQLPDVALDVSAATPEVQAHLNSCRECAETLEAIRSTIHLLDEWTAPEPSPYWDVRMQARLRQEQQRPAAGWLQWFHRPVLSFAAALSLVVGIGLYQAGRFLHDVDPPPQPIAFHIAAPTGTAVADLQYLDKKSDLLQNFDALDDMDGDADSDSNN